MKKLLGILVLGLLWCNIGFAEIIKNRCFGYQGYGGDLANHSDSFEWVEIIDREKPIYKWKVKGKNWNTQTEFLHFDDYNLVFQNPEGAILNLNFITFVTTYRGYTGYIQNDCVRETITKKPEQSPDDDKVVAASMGSGFFVTRAGHIVTNHHVIDQCKTVKVNYKGDEIPAKILASDKTNDLAIIQAKITPNKVYPVSNEDASLLQDVIVAGFPLGKKVSAVIKTHKGNITALAGFGDNFSNFQTDATINQGNSGGPIINLKGNVVGVAVQLIAAEHAQNIFFGVKSSTLKTFANAKGINFLPPNHREMSNENLSKLITEATVYLECWMTVAKIKQIIAQEENRKAFYSEHK